MNCSTAKAYIISVCLTVSYFVYGTAGLGVRGRVDEPPPVLDFRLLLDNQALSQLEYENGFAYQLATAMLLRVTGASHWAMQDISPYIGALSLAIVFLAGIVLYHRSVNDRGVGWLPFIAAFFVFSSALLRLLESTHIGYTFAFFSVGLLIVACSPRLSKVQVVLPVLIIFAVMMITNPFWQLAYGAIIALTMLLVNTKGRYSTTFLLPFIFAFSLSNKILVTGDPVGRYFRVATAAILGSGESAGGTTASGRAGSRIEMWPTVEMLDTTVSLWYFYVSGIFFVGLLCVIGGVFLIHHLWKHRDLPTTGWAFVAVSIICGSLLLVFILYGDLASLKRVLMLPGVFGVLWVITYLRLKLTNKQFRNVSAIIFIVLLLLTVPASNRFQLNGQGAYDNFASERQVEKVEWAHEYSSNNLMVIAPVERFVSAWVGEYEIKEYPDTRPVDISNVIYDNGEEGSLIHNSTGRLN